MKNHWLSGWQTRGLLIAAMLFFAACSSSDPEEGTDLEASNSDSAEIDGENQAAEENNEAVETAANDLTGDNFAATANGQNAAVNTAAASGPEAFEAAAPAEPVASSAPLAQEMPILLEESAPSMTGGLEMGMQGTAAGNGLPEMGSKLSYFVKKGDTLGRISKRIFGKPSHWRELAKLSGIKNANKIYPGQVIYYQLSESSLAFATVYEGMQKEETQVAPGETLETIAMRVYGKTDNWKLIWRQNDMIMAPDQLTAGMKVFYVAKAELDGLDQKVKAARQHVAAAKSFGFNAKALALNNKAQFSRAL